MKKILSAVLILTMVLILTACSGNTATVTQDTGSVVEDAATGTSAETGAADVETVATGNKITTDFVEMTITEAGMANSLKMSIKTGNITRKFGPDDSAETDFAYIKGTITNKSTSTLDEAITAIAKVGDYKLEEDDVYIYKSDGDTVWELSPLVEYNFMMCVEIPNALVESMESCDFNFGFNEGMENVLVDFDELTYKYSLKITPEAEVPAAKTAEQ